MSRTKITHLESIQAQIEALTEQRKNWTQRRADLLITMSENLDSDSTSISNERQHLADLLEASEYRLSELEAAQNDALTEQYKAEFLEHYQTYYTAAQTALSDKEAELETVSQRLKTLQDEIQTAKDTLRSQSHKLDQIALTAAQNDADFTKRNVPAFCAEHGISQAIFNNYYAVVQGSKS